MGAFEFVSGTTITVNPASLPAGKVGINYNQSITASGGSSPYSFSITAGSLPSGLMLSSDGTLSGMPDTPGSSNVTITATDSALVTGSRSYTIQINAAGSCLFCDDFNNGILDSTWTYLKGTWNETGGELVGVFTGKADAIANPVFSGCTSCTVDTTVRIGTEPDVRISVLSWYQNNKDYVELMLIPAKDKLILKQRVNGKIVLKSKAALTLNANIAYQVQLAFNGTNFSVMVDGASVLTIPAAVSPTGTVGFRTKKGTGRFDQITVQ
jgi:hypothetical protein